MTAPLALGASAVQASPPCECPGLEVWTAPADGATLPSNGRILVSARGLDGARVALTDEADRALPFALEAAGSDPDQRWVVPSAALPAGLVHLRFAATGAAEATQRDFEVVAGPDTTPPGLALGPVVAGHLDGACAAHTMAEVQVAGAADDAVALEVRLTPADGGATTTLWVPASAPVLGTFAAADWKSCLDNFPAARAGATWTATVTAWDAAGNADPASAPATFTFATASAGGGCAGGGAALGPGLGVALALLLLRVGGATRSDR